MRSFIDPIEQVGTYDPLPNRHGEKLCSLNIERILYYLSQGIRLEEGAAQLLGQLPFYSQTIVEVCMY